MNVIAITGRCVAFSERPWTMEGRAGITRKVTLADASSTFVVKLDQALADGLHESILSALRNADDLMDHRLTAEVTLKGDQLVCTNPQFFRLEPWAKGVTLEVAAKTGALK